MPFEKREVDGKIVFIPIFSPEPPTEEQQAAQTRFAEERAGGASLAEATAAAEEEVTAEPTKTSVQASQPAPKPSPPTEEKTVTRATRQPIIDPTETAQVGGVTFQRGGGRASLAIAPGFGGGVIETDEGTAIISRPPRIQPEIVTEEGKKVPLSRPEPAITTFEPQEKPPIQRFFEAAEEEEGTRRTVQTTIAISKLSSKLFPVPGLDLGGFIKKPEKVEKAEEFFGSIGKGAEKRFVEKSQRVVLLTKEKARSKLSFFTGGDPEMIEGAEEFEAAGTRRLQIGLGVGVGIAAIGAVAPPATIPLLKLGAGALTTGVVGTQIFQASKTTETSEQFAEEIGGIGVELAQDILTIRGGQIAGTAVLRPTLDSGDIGRKIKPPKRSEIIKSKKIKQQQKELDFLREQQRFAREGIKFEPDYRVPTTERILFRSTVKRPPPIKIKVTPTKTTTPPKITRVITDTTPTSPTGTVQTQATQGQLQLQKVKADTLTQIQLQKQGIFPLTLQKQLQLQKQSQFQSQKQLLRQSQKEGTLLLQLQPQVQTLAPKQKTKQTQQILQFQSPFQTQRSAQKILQSQTQKTGQTQLQLKTQIKGITQVQAKKQSPLLSTSLLGVSSASVLKGGLPRIKIGVGKKKKKTTKRRRRIEKQFTPSIVGIATGRTIKTTPTRAFAGFEIRFPVQKKGKKKRKRGVI